MGSKSLMFPVMFVIPALFMLLLAAYVAGGTTLTCRRVESTQVDCTLNTVRWLGLVAVDETVLRQVQGAKLNTYDCSDQDAQGRQRSKRCEALAIVTATGEVQPDLLSSSASEINAFVASTEPSLTVENKRWPFTAGLSCFALLWLFSGNVARQQMSKKGRTGGYRDGTPKIKG